MNIRLDGFTLSLRVHTSLRYPLPPTGNDEEIKLGRVNFRDKPLGLLLGIKPAVNKNTPPLSGSLRDGALLPLKFLYRTVIIRVPDTFMEFVVALPERRHVFIIE